PALAWAMTPDTMGNLRAVLGTTFGVGDSLASRCSSILWLLTMATILAVDLRWRFPVELTWGLTLLTYLLLSPLVSWTGELHLALLLVMVGRENPRRAADVRWMIMGLVLAILYIPPRIDGYQLFFRPLIVFVGKILLARLTWRQWPPSRTSSPLKNRLNTE